MNLRVLMLGKNRIRKVELLWQLYLAIYIWQLYLSAFGNYICQHSDWKVEGLTDCPKLSVLDLHGNRYELLDSLTIGNRYDQPDSLTRQ